MYRQQFTLLYARIRIVILLSPVFLTLLEEFLSVHQVVAVTKSSYAYPQLKPVQLSSRNINVRNDHLGTSNAQLGHSQDPYQSVNYGVYSGMTAGHEMTHSGQENMPVPAQSHAVQGTHYGAPAEPANYDHNEGHGSHGSHYGAPAEPAHHQQNHGHESFVAHPEGHKTPAYGHHGHKPHHISHHHEPHGESHHQHHGWSHHHHESHEEEEGDTLDKFWNLLGPIIFPLTLFAAAVPFAIPAIPLALFTRLNSTDEFGEG